MTLYPEVQLRAREEIDRVVGTHRLPTLDERPNLPYIEAIVKEAFRWHPAAPMGLPHVSDADDMCNGYFVPKGAMIMPNIWSVSISRLWLLITCVHLIHSSRLFTHDPDVYAEPMVFNPERFMHGNMPPDPRNFVFGFGRRICPGKLLADASIWLTIAKSLAALDMKRGIQGKGEVGNTPLFAPGVLSRPIPFHVRVEPRTPGHAALVHEVEISHPPGQSSARALQRIEVDEADLLVPGRANGN